MNEIYSFILENILPAMLNIIILIIPIILSVAYLTYAERKIIASMQLRRGPNVVGPFGLLQPLADGLKLMLKEQIIPNSANKFLFLLAPIITFTLALIGWAVIPIGNFVIADVNLGLIYLLAVSALEVYGVIIAGWASNSRYAFLGAIRSTAQMISYEISMGLIVISVILMVGSFNLTEIIETTRQFPWYIELFFFPMAVIFFISVVAETNRHPFDLPEAEAELVSGYNVEYSSSSFALFFLGEYANMILVSALTVILFFGGWYPPIDIEILYSVPPAIWMIFKILCCLFVFIWIRAALPRYRYDQLMRLGWKIFLPISLLWVFLSSTIVVFFM